MRLGECGAQSVDAKRRPIHRFEKLASSQRRIFSGKVGWCSVLLKNEDLFLHVVFHTLGQRILFEVGFGCDSAVEKEKKKTAPSPLPESTALAVKKCS